MKSGYTSKVWLPEIVHSVNYCKSYAFLLSLLDKELEEQKEQLQRYGYHRTGRQCRNTPTPLYRIQLALANQWNLL